MMYTTKGCGVMNMHYNIELKKKLCENICLRHASTIKILADVETGDLATNESKLK